MILDRRRHDSHTQEVQVPERVGSFPSSIESKISKQNVYEEQNVRSTTHDSRGRFPHGTQLAAESEEIHAYPVAYCDEGV